MQIAFVIGSQHKTSQSAKVGRFIADRVSALKIGNAFTLDLGKTPLPFFDGSLLKTDEWKAQWNPIAHQLTASDAAVIVTPEWGGMATPATKNFFLLCGHTLAHKPALIVAVSSGRGGAYPISELRASSYKNTYVNFLPEHLIVRNAEQMLNGPTPADTEDDRYLHGRIDYALKILAAYAAGAKQLRESGLLDLKTYPFGM